jgi:hypothetical protein
MSAWRGFIAWAYRNRWWLLFFLLAEAVLGVLAWLFPPTGDLTFYVNPAPVGIVLAPLLLALAILLASIGVLLHRWTPKERA